MLSAYPRAQAVIFDMDGILVDSEPFWKEVETAVFDDIGVDIRPLLGRGLTLGLRVDEVVAFFRERLKFTEAKDEELVERVVGGVVSAILTRGEILPGALEALKECEQLGLRRALASGSTPVVIEAVLHRLDLSKHFDVVCSAADDDMGKPHPAIFIRTAELLGVPAAGCLVLEDSLNGCVAAKAARMRVIAIPQAASLSDERFKIADLVLSSLTEFSDPRVLELLGMTTSAFATD